MYVDCGFAACASLPFVPVNETDSSVPATIVPAIAASSRSWRRLMAVSVEQAALRPGETTQLFVIRERRADD